MIPVAWGDSLKGLGVDIATRRAALSFAFLGFSAKFLFAAEFFGSGFSRDRPITAFLSSRHSPSFFVISSDSHSWNVFMPVSNSPPMAFPSDVIGHLQQGQRGALQTVPAQPY